MIDVREDRATPLGPPGAGSAARETSAGSVQPVRRFVWRPREVEAVPNEPSPRLLGRRIAVLGGSGESASQVMSALRAAGAAPARLEPPHEGGQVAAFLWDMGRLDGIVDLNHEQPFDLSDSERWGEQLWQTIELLRGCYERWRAESGTERLFYVAVTRMDGTHGYGCGPLAQPLGGLWAGLAKSLPREFDNVNVRVLDFPAAATRVEPLDAAMAAQLCRELYRWGPFEIGHADGRRYTLVAERAEVPDPVLTLGPGDVVVLSGGGRGIGFALARQLAGKYGCRVLVSGRSPLPDPGDAVNTLSEDEFRAYRERTLVAAARQRTLAAARAALERATLARELLARLAAAKAEGLDIDYYQCDVTEPDQVRALLAAAGPGLAGVVHDAGVDAPVRLPGKSAEVVRRTTAVKVTGLLNLIAALQDRPPVRFFSTAGSLAGRWGGMVGQLEYAAANEAASRIGRWAAGTGSGLARPVPVATMCWPTWERLGIITNYEATLAYMSAMSVPEGLRHWEREILAGSAGEFTFVGAFGQAITPVLLRAYPPAAGLIGLDHLAGRLLFLGAPTRFVAGSTLETELVLGDELAPAFADFRVDGSPAMPLGLLLEYLRSLADWVQPDGPVPPLSAIGDIRVNLSALREAGIGARLRAGVLRQPSDHRAWQVSVEIWFRATQLASATLHYGDTGDGPDDAGRTEEIPVGGGSVRRLQWNGQALRLGRWSVRDDAATAGSAEVVADRGQDLVLAVPAPRSVLPLNQLETLLWHAYRRQAPTALAHLRIEAIEFPGPLSGSAGRVTAAGATSTAYTPAGQVRLTMRGIRYA
ncbi:KR domain-containing protein [Nocardia brasiliensis]|uniref:KR domain-containing protein n=1 Tax=Nocardia brasiliensis TaxID=37326 RepID=A0A6G9XMV3_NOCBR|nr:KR domain-containing protein [Nocardia brasiliensis]QIS02180.1 KR domain-containing protein [Nocardia brasiliensis]